jgi:hypothetical protein
MSLRLAWGNRSLRSLVQSNPLSNSLPSSLSISKTVSLPVQAALWTFAFLAIKDAGKTYGAAKLAEQMIQAGVPIVAIDPLGIWWGLRVGIEGHPGLPVLIFGGDHKDLPIPLSKGKQGQTVLDEEKLKLTVRAFLEAGLSVVIDTSELSKNLQRRAGAIVCEQIYQQNKHFGTRHVFIEETDMLAPQSISGDLFFSKGAVDDLVRRGGNFNIGCTIISQRSAVVNKDILTQCDCLVALRIMAKIDKDAVKTWVDNVVSDDAERRKLGKWYDSLRSLENGEAWIYSPRHKIELTKFRFGQRETLHASREYFRQEHWQQKNIRLVDVAEFVQKFKTKLEPPPKPKPLEPVKLPTTSPALDKPFSGVGYKPPGPEAVTQPATSLQGTGDHSPSMELTNTVYQSRPQLEIHQLTPVLKLPVEQYDQPTTTLGRIAVVLKNGNASKNNSLWTEKMITDYIQTHAWPVDGLKDAINLLIRWEILTPLPNNKLRFYPDRIAVIKERNDLYPLKEWGA